MYSYFCCFPTDGNITTSTPSIGVLELPVLSIKGRYTLQGNIKSVTVVDLLGSPLLDTDTHFSLAPKLHQQLGLSPQQQAYRFDINITPNAVLEDFHFSIIAEVELLDGELSKILLCHGVIQPVVLPQRAVFVVGSPRSGTSALGKACRKSLRSSAHGESHVVEGINRMLTTAEDFFQQSKTASIKGNLVSAIPNTVFIAQQLTALRQIYRLYYGDEILLDKTPGIPMLDSLPLALMAWPHAKVIFCKRRAMENVQSRIIKFPKISFEQHVKQWRQSFVAWRNSKQKINKLLKHNQWYIEVDQFDMATNTATVVKPVSELLAFDKREANVFEKQLSSDDRPEQTSVIQSSTKSIEDFGWTDSQIALFKGICDKEMTLQNYSYDKEYYISTNPIDTEQKA